MTSDHETTEKSGSRFCAHCGTENDIDTYSCDRCGERIYLPDPLKPPPMGLVECQTCTTPNESRAVYCVICGNTLTNAARISILGGADPERQIPHSQPGGIRLRRREHEPAVRQAPVPERKRPAPGRKRSETEGNSAERPEPTSTAREPELEREKRDVARARVAEQEQQKSEASDGENTSGNRSAQLPQSARGWNTAAFLIGPIWGPANGVWIGVVGIVFLVIPESILPLAMKFTLYLAYGAFLGIRGNQLAWRARRWNSLEQFKRVQQQWMLLALVVNLALLFIIPIMLR